MIFLSGCYDTLFCLPFCLMIITHGGICGIGDIFGKGAREGYDTICLGFGAFFYILLFLGGYSGMKRAGTLFIARSLVPDGNSEEKAWFIYLLIVERTIRRILRDSCH